MKAKKFINAIKEYLGLEDLETKGKKKSVKTLLDKLTSKHNEISKKLDENLDEKELNEELDIISLHIKKAEKILENMETMK